MTKIEIFQAENEAIEFKGDSNHETVWANLEQTVLGNGHHLS